MPYTPGMATMDRVALADLVVRFTEAFNDNDLDGVMAYMADDAVYEEFTGTINRGRDAIRAAFVPNCEASVAR